MKTPNTTTTDPELDALLTALDNANRCCLACGGSGVEFTSRFSRTCIGCADELAADYDAWMADQVASRHLADIPGAAPWEIEWAMKGGPL